MITAPSINPMPTASPIQAQVHMLAAEVSPLIWCPETMMDPAPRKPMPLITWAAILDRSTAPGNARYIYWAVSITVAAPRHTAASILAPPPRFFAPRSIPITEPSTRASTIRSITFLSVHSVNDRKNILYPPCAAASSPKRFPKIQRSGAATLSILLSCAFLSMALTTWKP